MNVNPGSGNVIGGLTVAISVHGRVVDEMVLRSPSGLKSALGENPKRVYGDKKQRPSTRLGAAAVLRGAFVDAQNYQAKLAAVLGLATNIVFNGADAHDAMRKWCAVQGNLAQAKALFHISDTSKGV